MKRIVLKPLIHAVVRKGHRDQHGQRHQLYEVGGEQRPETRHAGTKHFADADLLCTLFNDEGGETEEAQAGNKDSQAGEHRCEIAYPRLRIKLLLKLLINERIDKGAGQVELFEDGFHRGEGGAYRRTGFDAYRKDGMATFAHEDRGLHREIGTIADHVFRDPDDGIGLSLMFDDLADGVFESEDAGACFVNDGLSDDP